jgi:hypothetical protein
MKRLMGHREEGRRKNQRENINRSSPCVRQRKACKLGGE